MNRSIQPLPARENRALFSRVSNPMRPDHPTPEEIKWADGTTFSVRDILKRKYGPDFLEFPQVTIILKNTQPLMRANWNDPLAHGDIIVEVPVLTGIIEAIVIALVIVAVVAAVVIAATMKIPKVAGGGGSSVGNGLGDAGSVYNLNGAANQSRLGSPIEVSYGRNRLYPGYACPWYNRYSYNQQYLYALYCLGQGTFDIEKIMIGDTDATNFPEAVITVIPPNTRVGGVWPRVRTAAEVTNVELKAPNEVDFPGGILNSTPDPLDLAAPMPGLGPEAGWFGKFALNPFGTKVYRIDCDIVLPSGLYYIPQSGDNANVAQPGSVFLEFQYRQINDNGSKGAWTHLMGFNYTPSKDESSLYLRDDTATNTTRVSLSESDEGTVDNGYYLETPRVPFVATASFIAAILNSDNPIAGTVRIYDTADNLLSSDVNGVYSTTGNLKASVIYQKRPDIGASTDSAIIQISFIS